MHFQLLKEVVCQVAIITVIFEYYSSVIFCLISNFVSVIDFKNIKHIKKETLTAVLASCEKENQVSLHVHKKYQCYHVDI